MLHRVIFGSMERFIAILIESTGGIFPLWLTPEQVVVLPISEKYNAYAQKVAAMMEENDVRARVDLRNEKVGKKIREAELQKMPFMVIVGENEEKDGTVSVRRHQVGDMGVMTVDALCEAINREVKESIQQFK